MSKVFNFYGGTITYKGDTDTYLQIYNTLIDEAGKAKSKYRKAYKDWGDVETFLDYGYGYVISLMEDIFLKFSDVFMAHRYYNFSIDLFCFIRCLVSLVTLILNIVMKKLKM